MKRYFLIGGLVTFAVIFVVFWYDSGYHTPEGAITSLLLTFFYKKFKLKRMHRLPQY